MRRKRERAEVAVERERVEDVVEGKRTGGDCCREEKKVGVAVEGKRKRLTD